MLTKNEINPPKISISENMPTQSEMLGDFQVPPHHDPRTSVQGNAEAVGVFIRESAVFWNTAASTVPALTRRLPEIIQIFVTLANAWCILPESPPE